jgi:hypothetical protein
MAARAVRHRTVFMRVSPLGLLMGYVGTKAKEYIRKPGIQEDENL